MAVDIKKLNPHDFVAYKATRFLMRGHGCFIGAINYSGGWSPEQVDGIAWNGYGSFLVEAKMSISDFRADAKKEFRQNPESGVGKYRYYACPEGLLKPEDLPEKWGLIYVNEKGKCSMPCGCGFIQKNGSWFEKNEKHTYHGSTEINEHGNEICKEKDDFIFPYDLQKENGFLIYLAKRYREQKFMQNII